MLALVPLMVIKVYGHYRRGSERQEQEKKKKACRLAGGHRVGAGDVHMVKRCQIPLTPVPGAIGGTSVIF